MSSGLTTRPARVALSQVLLAGTVRPSRNGRADATIDIYAWPSSEQLHLLKPGQVVSRVLVGHAQASNGGAFLAGGSVRSLSRAYKSSDGSLSLEAVVSDGASTAAWYFPKNASGTTRTVELDLPHRTAVDLSVIAGDTPQETSLRNPRATSTLAVSVSAEPARRSSGGYSRPTPAVTCGYFVWSATSTRMVSTEYFVTAVGSGHAAATTTETGSSNHTLGIAMYSGGAWGASGSANLQIRSGGSTSTQPIYYANRWANRVYYRKYLSHNICSNVADAYQWRPDAPYSYLNIATLVMSPTRYTNCAYYPAGAKFSKSTGSTATYTAGVDLGVISVSASADWGSDTDVAWVAEATTAYCGNDAGPASSTLVETHS